MQVYENLLKTKFCRSTHASRQENEAVKLSKALYVNEKAINYMFLIKNGS